MVSITLRHLVSPIDNVGKFKLYMRFIRKPVTRTILGAWIRGRWRTIGRKVISILVPNLPSDRCKKMYHRIDGVSTHHLIFHGIFWCSTTLELSVLHYWGGWFAHDFEKREQAPRYWWSLRSHCVHGLGHHQYPCAKYLWHAHFPVRGSGWWGRGRWWCNMGCRCRPIIIVGMDAISLLISGII